MKKGKRLFKFVPTIGEKPQFSCIGYENVHCQSNNEKLSYKVKYSRHTHTPQKNEEKTKTRQNPEGFILPGSLWC